MDFLDLVKNRYSCRSFLNKEIEEEKINKILECDRFFLTNASDKGTILTLIC